MSSHRHLLVVNPTSGSRPEVSDLIEEARRRLSDVEVFRLGGSGDLEVAVGQAVAEERTVVAAGGDGTVNAVVQHMPYRGTLGVLPGGTLNHFARDLGLRNLKRAFEALQAGQTRRVDVGKAGDRFFVNGAGMGLYPELVRERGEQGGLGRWMATAAATVRVLRKADPVRGVVAADGDERLLLAWIVFVGNNRYGTKPGRIGVRTRLDEGLLDLRLLTVGSGRQRRGRLAWSIARERAWRARRVIKKEALRVDIRVTDRPRLVSRDGEAEEARRSISFQIVPGALRVVGPPD